MQTITDGRTLVKHSRIYHSRLYATALVTYAATWENQHGIIEGTARELYAHGGIMLEFQATHCTERRFVRRQDTRLTLQEVHP